MTKKLSKFLYGLAIKVENKEVSNKAITLQRTIFKHLCELMGLAWLTFAGFSVNIVAGSMIAGISCFVLSWRFDMPGDSGNRAQSTV